MYSGNRCEVLMFSYRQATAPVVLYGALDCQTNTETTTLCWLSYLHEESDQPVRHVGVDIQ